MKPERSEHAIEERLAALDQERGRLHARYRAGDLSDEGLLDALLSVSEERQELGEELAEPAGGAQVLERLTQGFQLWHLSDGREVWCTCVPISETDGAVVGGNWGYQDVVRLPAGWTWRSAARPGGGSGAQGFPAATPVGPFDVETVFDAVTGFAMDPAYSGRAHLETSPVFQECYLAWLEGLLERSRREAA